MKKILLFISTFLSVVFMNGKATEYGLHIQTWPHQSSEFTSIALEDGNPIRIDNKATTLKFKVWNRSENVFGVVFRIITDKNKTIDLMYSVSENDERYPNLIVNNKVYPLTTQIRLEEWIEVYLDINIHDKTLRLTYDGEEITVSTEGHDMSSIQDLRIFFGGCPLVEYDLDNIASINLKDISISHPSGNFREWDLKMHKGDTSYDNLKHSPATIKNGHWLIDQHMVWKPVLKKHFSGTPSIAFDSENATLYISKVGEDITAFDCRNRMERSIDVNEGEQASIYPNNLLFIDSQDRLLSFNLDQDIYSTFKHESGRWSGRKAPEKNHKEYYWNNSVTWDKKNSALISFGGYGHYQFNNELLISYPYDGNIPQKKVNLKEIAPRYSPATVLVDSLLYIFGGRGNSSGKQEMTQRYYYDLHCVNINTLEVTCLWDIPQRPAEGDFLPGSNMVYDRENDCFYIFSSQEGGTLMRINRQKPEVETMSIPARTPLDAQYLYTNLYYSESEQKMYGLYQQTQVNGNSQIYLHEICFPPIVLADTFSSGSEPSDKGGIRWGIIAVASIILAAIAGVSAQVIRSRRGKKKTINGDNEHRFIVEMPEFHNYDFSRSSICFFGGFRVQDSEGKDITDLFTPTLKALTIILILHTCKDSKGISGNRLIQTLWYDKTEESAKNNRNVYMSKLRNILDKVGNVKILNQKGFWSIEFNDNAICDYMEANRLFADKSNKEDNLEKLIEILLRGAMLPNMEEDWVDSFKTDFSNITIDFLTGLFKRTDLSDAFLLKISDTLFLHDFINEEALKVKCSILYRQGKKGLAKTVYDAFCKDYQSSLGSSFPVSMIDLISSRPD